ncbi:MAG: ArgR family transcriptional regulator [Spirochaetales bacterium]
MKERLNRLKVIRKLIKSSQIKSQESLLQCLSQEGFSVTQATLSRDLKLLKVGKLSDNENGYVYVLPEDDEYHDNHKMLAQDFLRGYISIDYSGNIAVIKTYSGYSDVVAVALDNLGMEEVLGTIAGGDNCVFACLREGITGEQFLQRLKEKIPDIDE